MRVHERPLPTESFTGKLVKGPKWLIECLSEVYPVNIENDKIVISFKPFESIGSNGQVLDSRYVSEEIDSYNGNRGVKHYILKNGSEFEFKI